MEEGDIVSVHYDPMIAKLVVWGENSDAALVKLKNCLQNFQVAGLPTNISFLQILANHWAFEEGLVETHFIEHFKNDLFVESTDGVAKETYAAARLGAKLVASCLWELDCVTAMETFGGNNLLSLWYSSPPFCMHHAAKCTVELEWEKESSGSFQEPFKLAITYQTTGSYFTKIEDSDLPSLEVKVVHFGKGKFCVDADGLSSCVTLAFYWKDDNMHIHIWHDKHHHHYRQTVRLNQYSNNKSHKKPIFDMGSWPKGSVMAPMASLVVKVLLENGVLVEEDQPILVLEVMKMENIVTSPCAGYVDGLKVSPGEQVFDTSVLFSIKDCTCASIGNFRI